MLLVEVFNYLLLTGLAGRRCGALTTAKLVMPMSEVALVTELAEAVLLVIFAHAGFEVGCTAGAAAALAVAIRSGCH